MRTERVLPIEYVDDFLPNPDSLRRQGLEAEFEDFGHQGWSYPGVAVANESEPLQQLQQRSNTELQKNLCYFRSNRSGMDHQVWIHTDERIAPTCLLVYLSEPRHDHDGTAFWRHRRTGMEQVFPDLPQALAEEFTRDTLDESKWDMVAFVPAKYNRAIRFPNHLFHSRYPNNIKADCAETSRLTHVTFFDKKEFSGTGIHLLPFQDIKRLDKLGQQFFDEYQVPGTFQFETFVRHWETLYSQGLGFILASEKNHDLIGVIGGLITPECTSGRRVATELFWFVDHEKRNDSDGIRLFKAFEKECIQRGVQEIRVGRGAGHDRLHTFYEKKGYRYLESMYLKEVDLCA